MSALAPRVIGTAGHIDHGKTALVEALTGVWTDRLPEELERGISIDLGFAPLDLGEGAPPASVIDVPGHEAFIKNMVAGASGIDAALFVVAADEGMMPQSREHLLVLEALGVERAVIAITKVDLVEREWAELVGEAVGEEIAGTRLAGASVVLVSARTGEGIDRLRAELARVVLETPARAADFPFRLPVDRVFGLAGVGTVVTGTVWSGSLGEGDTVFVLPPGLRARVRSIQVHGCPVSAARAGHRAALALTRIDGPLVERGCVLVGDDRPWHTARRLDARMWLAASAPRPLRAGARVRLHHGTSEIMARVRPYDTPALEPGGLALCRLLLEAPIVPAVGDRFVLRAYSPMVTIGGGEVLALDPPRVRGIARAARTARLAALGSARGAERLQLALDVARTTGVGERALPLETGLGASALEVAIETAGDTIERHGARWFARAVREALMERLVAILAAHHAAEPLQPGLSLEAARQRLRSGPERSDPLLVEAVISALEDEGRIERRGAFLGLTGWRTEIGAEDRGLIERLRALYVESGIEAPDTTVLADRLGVEPRRLRSLQHYLEREGEIIKLASDWYADAAALDRAEQALVERLAIAGSAETGAFKDLFGVSRKYLIPLLEYFDRRGVTRREGNRRVLV